MFIQFVVSGANGFLAVLCSASDLNITQKLQVSQSLVGMANTVLLVHVRIQDYSAYAEFAMGAEDLT